jgi:type II secretory pathway pseudopilin PulG
VTRPRLLSDEGGFGIVELLIALTVMAVGISAIVMGLTSGIVALNRASMIGTAGTLADRQMETYRALPYTQIALSADGTGTTYTTDAAYPAPGYSSITACASGCMLASTSTEAQYCSSAPTTFPAPCAATQASVTGPDGRKYRIDTFITWYCGIGTPTNMSTSSPSCLTAGTAVSRPLKQVTVVVRDASTSKQYFRESSTFDQAT